MSQYTEYNQGNQPTKGIHPMVVLQPGEQVVCEIKRHPFGIISMYIGAGIAIIAAALLVFIILPIVSEQVGNDQLTSYAYAGLAVVGVLGLIVLGVATIVYWQNLWVVTTDSITQITQRGLFDRQVAQLSMDNLEDVTVDQNGILPHLFNFGTLKVETAGERSKFYFVYCPNPNECARQILDVHEKFLAERRDLQILHRPTMQTNSSADPQG